VDEKGKIKVLMEKEISEMICLGARTTSEKPTAQVSESITCRCALDGQSICSLKAGLDRKLSLLNENDGRIQFWIQQPNTLWAYLDNDLTQEICITMHKASGSPKTVFLPEVSSSKPTEILLPTNFKAGNLDCQCGRISADGTKWRTDRGVCKIEIGYDPGFVIRSLLRQRNKND